MEANQMRRGDDEPRQRASNRWKGKTRQSYILDLVSERLSGKPNRKLFELRHAARSILEPYALKAFEKANETLIERVGFITTNDGRIGCSPDGLIGEDAGIEVKCPNPRQHLRNILSDGLSDYNCKCRVIYGSLEDQNGFLFLFVHGLSVALYCSVVTRDDDP